MPLIRKPKIEVCDLPSTVEEPKLDHAFLLPAIPKIHKFNRGRPNSVLRARRNSEGDFDTIDQDEAAAIIGKSTKTLQRWRAIGYGPSFKLDGRYVSYSRAEVEAWKAEHDLKRTPSACLFTACNQLQDITEHESS